MTPRARWRRAGCRAPAPSPPPPPRSARRARPAAPPRRAGRRSRPLHRAAHRPARQTSAGPSAEIVTMRARPDRMPWRARRRRRCLSRRHHRCPGDRRRRAWPAHSRPCRRADRDGRGGIGIAATSKRRCASCPHVGRHLQQEMPSSASSGKRQRGVPEIAARRHRPPRRRDVREQGGGRGFAVGAGDAASEQDVVVNEEQNMAISGGRRNPARFR